MDLTAQEIRWIIQALIILILSITVHEFGHAIVADKLGDRLPRSQGRVTLNPLSHADPIGTLAFPMIALVFTHGASTGFGWGRPVLVNPVSFSRRFSMRVGHLMVALAGPLMNVLFALTIALTHMILLATDTLSIGHELNRALQYAVLLNFVLAFFNMIPFPPLDGGAVLRGVLPTRHLVAFDKVSVYGPFVLLAFIAIPQLGRFFIVPAEWCTEHLYALFASIFF
jgi:Zn-dependent protease